ncbi:MAG: right-handed parallel beta-helix repeat-containing protein, partial [Bacteroidetes bacterium]|nr:right-handed parallel beta-helix repeat-containing protein [Bacteroidota bacterium]
DADCATPNAIVFVGETLSVDKTYTNQNIIIDDYLLIDEASVEFDNCIIYMEEDAYIKLNGLNSAPGVYDGQLQLINGTTIQACGDNMWGEIHLNGETATLIMDNATIRDAKKAIQFDGGSITSIDESTFDANYENIVVEYQAIVHLDDVEIVNSDFIGSTTMLSPYSSEERSLSAVKIVDCDDYDIQIGDIGKGNSFDGFETGIYVEASRLVILGNDFVDCNYGVDVVDMNTSRIASNTFSSTSDPGKMAIQLTSSGGSSNAVQVNYNEISGCFTGISVENNSNLSVEENTIELGEPEDGAVGIKLMNCANYLVRSNTVTGEDADNEEMMGYYVDISTNGTMKCNSVDLVGQGFWFGGTCTGTEFGGNEMHDCYNQFVLEDGGVIGTQGNSSYPHDNLWGGTYGNKQTLAIWSDGRDSEFHVQTGSPYEPTDNNHIPSSPDAYDVLISNGAANSYTGCSSKSASESGLSDAEEQMLFNNDNPEARWINDYGLFTTISQNMLLTEANHALSGWFTEKTLQSCGKLYLVGKAIGDSLYQDAFLLMNNCATTNHADSLLKKYYELYLEKAASGSTFAISAKEMNTLTEIAGLCPHEFGPAVYLSRGWLKSLGLRYQYDNSCNKLDDNRNSEEKAQLVELLSDGSESVYMFPNPTADVLTIDCGELSGTIALLLSDQSGRILERRTFVTGVNILDLSSLKSGIYIVKLISNENVYYGQIIKQ